jgi:CubicO group peptidase (beta-lactamase class C family)
MGEIAGHAPARFAAVKDALAASFAAGEELGARFTLVEAGEVVLDLWAGHADRARTRAFDETTLTPVFSTTKAIAALLMARLVDQGKLDYGQTVASVWPEFAAAGKDSITVEQLLSHQGGLSGFPDRMDPVEWFDWQAICARLAAMTPLWPPGTASGYHPITFGYLAGELFRRCAKTWLSRSAWTCGSACRIRSSTASRTCSGRAPCRSLANTMRQRSQRS